MKYLYTFIRRTVPSVKAVFSLMVVFSMLGTTAAPLTAYAGAIDLGITCDTATSSGNTWTFTGTWKAYDFVGQSTQYDSAVFSPLATLVDSSSKDLPDTFITTQGPSKYTGVANKDDMEGTWKNVITFAVPPTSVSATLYHSQVPGNETSGDAFCTFDINDVPTLSGVEASATIPELSFYTFDANATDPDVGATLTFSLSGAPSGASINSSTGVFTWTPTEAQGPGVYNFSVTVSDGSLSDTDPVALTVTEVNQAPVANSDSVTTNEDTPKNISLSGSDADLPAQILTFSIVSNPSNGSLSGLNTSTGAVTYTPALNFYGSDSFTFRVTDNYSGQSAPATISITVGSDNDAPALDSISDKTIDETVAFTFTASGSDADGDTLTFALEGEDNGASINSSTGQFNWTPTEEQGPGVYPFTVSMSDGTTMDTNTFSINVNELNLAPVLNTIGNKSVAETNLLTFSISATDADLPSNTLTYSVENLPDGATFVGDTFSWTPGFDQEGNYLVTFKISDGLAEDFEIVPIDVGDVNRSPVLNPIGNKSVNEGVMLTFGISGSDPDGDTLTYSASSLPSGASFDPDTKTFSWNPNFEQSGNYSVTFQVSDGTLTDEETITITVNEINRAPVAQNQSVSTDEDVSTGITILATDVDIPVQSLIYAVTSPIHGVLSSVDLSTGTMTYTPDLNYNGVDSFTFTANDSQDTSNTATISITVNPVNDEPVIQLNGDSSTSVTQGNPFIDDGAVCNDVEDGVLLVTVTGSVNTAVVGQYTLTYNCEDGNGATDEVSRTVDVLQGPAACMDDIDNDGDGLTDMQDPGCSSPNDNDETDLPQCSDGIDNDGDGKVDFLGSNSDRGCDNENDNDETNGGGGGNSGSIPNGGGGGGGSVLGVSTGPSVLGEQMCGEYITDYIKVGVKNDSANVSRLQTFLNKYMGLALAVDGVYGKGTYEAVKKFQVKESSEVLNPWIGVTLKGTEPGTGWVYKTTKRWINMIECPALKIPQFQKSELTY